MTSPSSPKRTPGFKAAATATLIENTPRTTKGRTKIFQHLRAVQDQLHRVSEQQLFTIAVALQKWGENAASPRDAALALVRAADLLTNIPTAAERLEHCLLLALRKDPGHVQALDRITERLRRRGTVEPLEHLWTAYVKAVSSRPTATSDDRGLAWRRLGDVRAQMLERFEAAIEAYDRSLEERADAATVVQLAETHMRRNLPGDASAASQLYAALGEVSEGAQGIQYLERALDLDPENSEALNLLESRIPVSERTTRLRDRWQALAVEPGQQPPQVSAEPAPEPNESGPIQPSVVFPSPALADVTATEIVQDVRSRRRRRRADRAVLLAAAACACTALLTTTDAARVLSSGPDGLQKLAQMAREAMPSFNADSQGATPVAAVGLAAAADESEEDVEANDDSDVAVPKGKPQSLPMEKTADTGETPELEGDVRLLKRLTRVRGARMPRRGLRRALAHTAEALKRCYGDALERDGDLEGKIVLSWQVRADGRVRRVGKPRGSMRDWSIRACAIRTIRDLRFPRTRGGIARVRSAFQLSPRHG